MKYLKKLRYVIPVLRSVIGNFQIILFCRLVTNIVKGYSIDVIRRRGPVAINNRIVPWFTFPAIEYLDSLQIEKRKVFEYGAGNSTIYFSKRGCDVSSSESSHEWGDYIRTKCAAKIAITKDKIEYLGNIHSGNSSFEIIVIDGLYRAECAREILKYEYLSDVRVVILDNSNWFPKTLNFLTQELGFVRIDFNGYSPKNHFPSKTTIFTNPKIVDDGWKYFNNDPLGSISTFDPNDF